MSNEDSLRDIVAAVLAHTFLDNQELVDVVYENDPKDVEVVVDCGPLADVLVAELGLEREELDDGSYRYISEWMHPDDDDPEDEEESV